MLYYFSALSDEEGMVGSEPYPITDCSVSIHLPTSQYMLTLTYTSQGFKPDDSKRNVCQTFDIPQGVIKLKNNVQYNTKEGGQKNYITFKVPTVVNMNSSLLQCNIM
jgi:hypothetical protein